MQYAASFNDLLKTEQALIDARIKFQKDADNARFLYVFKCTCM